MLTVIREMAEESERKEHRRVVPNDLLRAVLSAGEQSVARTPEILDILRNAGVVDAGAPASSRSPAGWSTARPGRTSPRRRWRRSRSASTRSTSSSPSFATAPCSSSRARSSTRTRSRRSSSGSATRSSSSATRPRSRCTSTRTTREGARFGTAVGVVEGVEIANMHHQTAQREERLLEEMRRPRRDARDRLVAVCPGRGNRRLFESLGATRVIEGGQSMNPSAKEILEAIEPCRPTTCSSSRTTPT